MESYEMLMWGLMAIWLFFVFALGACIGSLTNVVVYRMPRGISVVFPPSRCPKCDTRLSWRDNIPILGWVFLGGRCRYCKEKISAEYPIVELSVALLFALFYVVWYMIPSGSHWLGIPWDTVRPYWSSRNAPGQTWPTFVVFLSLLGSLVAMTIVDAKTYTIPLAIMWVPAVVGVLVHPIHAAVAGPMRATPNWFWAIPTPAPTNWPAILASIGGIVGLAVSNLLLRLGVIRPSFADYAEWEKAHLAQTPGGGIEAAAAPDAVVSAEPNPVGNPDVWVQYPHARREMIKEMAFLAPCGALAMGGYYLGQSASFTSAQPAPLWLTVLSGVFLGYLVGGGMVWAVRILGSLGFGKEAMGLGDVHLMAAVGASAGWIVASLGFFGAAFVGLFWAILGRFFSGFFQRMMPYGPFLAVATVLVLLLRRPIELGLGLMFHADVRIPP